MIDVILDTLLDGVKLLPFLFLTYLAMEFLEHKAGEKAEAAVQRSGKFGPLVGGVLGILPQCGFSAAAANFYAGRIISIGTLIAIFLSTSDEMLPILISAQISPLVIVKILGFKMLVGILFGFLIDLVFRLRQKNKEKSEKNVIEDLCDEENCHCNEKGIWLSALRHTLQIFIFILLISFALNTLIYFIGEDKLASLISGQPILSCLLSALVGLIPNCAASVVITDLCVRHVISVGAMLSGLLTGAGIGLLILFRVNKHNDKKEYTTGHGVKAIRFRWNHRLWENLGIALLLYLLGAGVGLLVDLTGFSAFFGI